MQRRCLQRKIPSWSHQDMGKCGRRRQSVTVSRPEEWGGGSIAEVVEVVPPRWREILAVPGDIMVRWGWWSEDIPGWLRWWQQVDMRHRYRMTGYGKGRQRYWHDGEMMVTDVPDKRTGGRAVEDTLEFLRERKWRQKICRQRCALEDVNNDDGNGAYKGQTAEGSWLWRQWWCLYQRNRPQELRWGGDGILPPKHRRELPVLH